MKKWKPKKTCKTVILGDENYICGFDCIYKIIHSMKIQYHLRAAYSDYGHFGTTRQGPNKSNSRYWTQ